MKTCEVEMAATKIALVNLLSGSDLIDKNMEGVSRYYSANLT